MKSNRRSATVVGVLYITGSVAGVATVILTDPAFNAPDSLLSISTSENQLIAAALLVLAMGLALALVR